MDSDTRKRLRAAGWAVGNTREFLSLSDAEIAYVDMKLALARGLREVRELRNMTQAEVADLIGSSQSRVAKMEAADASVSMDLLIRSLLKLGATEEDVSRLVGQRPEAAV